ncbi:MAG: hypothetical protein ACI945_002367 [Pseudohongiellaceae bacterium]|jgi:hypothetical protein
MRELSEQEIKNVSGGVVESSAALSPSSTSVNANEFQYFIQLPVIVPQLNIVEDFFKHNTDS